MLDNIELIPILDSVERLQMEDPEYFALDAVSNSRLSLINPDQGGSPQKFFIEKKFTESSALELGSGVHQLLLEKDKYFLSEFEKPGGKVGTIIKLAYTLANRESNPLSYDEALQISCKTHDYYSTCLTDNRLAALKEKGAPYYEFLGKESKPGMIVLTTDQKDKCIKCVGSVKANQVAYNLLYPQTSETLLSFHEDVLVMDIKGVIKDPDLELDTDCLIKIKSKLDHWSIDLEKNIITLNDLKTTGKPIQFFPGRKTETKDIFGNNAFIDGSFQTYHYHRQMAMYGWVLLNYCNKMYGERDWTLNINMIVVETFGLFLTQVFRVGQKWSELGFTEFKNLMKHVIYHQINGLESIPELNNLEIIDIE